MEASRMMKSDKFDAALYQIRARSDALQAGNFETSGFLGKINQLTQYF
jgi:hypothetical protein